MGPLYQVREDAPLELYTDASDLGMGYVLTQIQDGECRIEAHGSKKFTETEQRHSTIEKEAKAIYNRILHFRPLLIRKPFVVYTDHRNLTFLLKTETPKLQRWRLALQEYVFEVHHVAGANNPADYPSRH